MLDHSLSKIALVVVFPPFHWVFLEGKREKERKKKGIVKILAHFNISLHKG
jgi:hypothetical protein